MTGLDASASGAENGLSTHLEMEQAKTTAFEGDFQNQKGFQKPWIVNLNIQIQYLNIYL
jgi:hypothetical protein